MLSLKFTCIACRVAFSNSDVQRQHYKTDWHRFNLKRKVGDMPPVTSDEFLQKVITQREKDDLESKKSAVYCKACRKSFQSEKAFSNHLLSKKHKVGLVDASATLLLGTNKSNSLENPCVNTEITSKMHVSDICCPSMKKVSGDNIGKLSLERRISMDSSCADEDSEVEEVDSDEWDEDPSENNPILHNNCLFCLHHSGTFMKNLKHMSIAHSFFIPDAEYVTDLKGLLLYLGEKVCQGFLCLWCNNQGRSFHSMEAAMNHMLDKGHCKMLHEGEALMEYTEFYDYRKSYPDYNSTESNDNEEIKMNLVEENDFQLVLPSGAVIGHRSLMRYFRQNIDPNKAMLTQHKKINALVSGYRALGWKGSDKEAVVRKLKDISCLQRVRNKYTLKIGLKGNKLQKHFRPQVNF